MRIFNHRRFHQWAKSEEITNQAIKKAVTEMQKGLWDANLGSGLYKKRIALAGKGKRGSYRTLVAFRNEKYAFFVYGFAKNVRSDISEQEEKIYRELSKSLLGLSEEIIKKMIEKNKLYEVTQ